ncbi:MAG: ABC transporter substrate-binding protein [Proteobacteria bacterium]|nr:ABC transporter substrate-binding protein [Pseudomonadota bacterium]
MTTIRLAYSPDSDDAFMFWALKTGRLNTSGVSFEHRRADTEALNRSAELRRNVDVCAISIHQYAYVAEDFLLLPHGGSVGSGYGPVLVAREGLTLGELRGARIGVPGVRTTAYLVLRLLLPDFEPVVVPISPFSGAFDAVLRGSVRAALIIHEGRLFFQRYGLIALLELGEAWGSLTGLPLPLGGNVIRRSLGGSVIRTVSQVLHSSIAWGLQNRDQVIDEMLASEARGGVPRERAMLERYLAMYANRDTLDYGATGRRAIVELLKRGLAAGILPQCPPVEFAP